MSGTWLKRVAFTAAVAAGLLCPRIASAQVLLTPEGPVNPQQKSAGPAAGREPETVRLVVDAAREPSPALRYRLTTPYLDRKPGNAVPYYYRALVQFLDGRRDDMKQYYENEERWLEARIDELPRDEVREFLGSFSSVFDSLHRAAQRETLDWDWRMQDLEGTEPIAFLLPEIQESRSLARLLRLKVRLEIAEGRYDDAIKTFRSGYALARAVGQPPTLINDLVGIAIASIMHAELRELIAAPGAPNLYWALADLPDPLIEIRDSLQYELSMPVLMFPFLRKVETAGHSDEEWGRILRESFDRYGDIEGLAGSSAEPSQRIQLDLMAAGLALKGYPRAKRELIAAGYDRQRVEQLPVAQVVLIHEARTFRHIQHEMQKWTLLPFNEAREGMARAEEELKRQGYFGPAGSTREIIPIASMLFPAVHAASEAQVRLQSRTAGLRALEAVRMHAATNGGKLPALLEEITIVPVPVNPRDGQPFPYRLEGETAILEVPLPDHPQIGWRMAITLRDGK